MKFRTWLALLLTVCLMLPVGLAAAESVTELPRNETLYINGLQWGSINGWNAVANNDMNNPLVIGQGTAFTGGARVTMFETLYMYNMLDGSLVPLLADGPYEWNDDLTEMTVKIKPAAKWSDGTPVTAEDVAYTFKTNVTYASNVGTGFGPYVASVEAVDPATVLIKAALTEDGKPVNPLYVVSFIEASYVLQKAWLETLEERNGYDAVAIMRDPADDIVSSGPYGKLFADDTKTVIVRDDSYWGQD
ncbi:MAG: ABC transporter substrate-binding protein, partial [Firmicutes bacterium]|nr:ABC transporter substrate-binding protein [Bacillota bacterium]